MSQSKQLLLCCVFALVLSTMSTILSYECRPVETSECGTGYKAFTVLGDVHIDDLCTEESACQALQKYKFQMERCETDDLGNSCTSNFCVKALEYEGWALSPFCNDLTVDTPFVYDCEKTCSECEESLSCVYNTIGSRDRVFERCSFGCDYLSFISGTYTQCESIVGLKCCQKNVKNEKKICLESNNALYAYSAYLDEVNVKGYFAVLMAMALAMLF